MTPLPSVQQWHSDHRCLSSVAINVWQAIARDALSLILWDFARAAFDTSRLPPDADPRVLAFFAAGGYDSGHGSARWFELCQERPALQYMSGGAGIPPYELHPSADNLIATLKSLLGTGLTSPTQGTTCPLWLSSADSGLPTCHASWELRNGGTDRPVLVLRPNAVEGAQGSDDDEEGCSAVGGDSAVGAVSEELRLIFTEGVHCYALRRVISDEPLWVEGIRRAWLQRWRQSGACVADGLGDAQTAAVASALIGNALLAARAHQLRPSSGMEVPSSRAADGQAAHETEGDTAAAHAAKSAMLAVLCAAPYDFEERRAGLRLLLSAGPRAWDALPLLLQPPAISGTWDDLALDSCAELLHALVEPPGEHMPTPDSTPLWRSGSDCGATDASGGQSAAEAACGGTANAAAAVLAATSLQPPLQALLAVRAAKQTWLHEAIERCSDSERSQVLRVTVGFSGFTLSQRAAAVMAIGNAWCRWLWGLAGERRASRPQRSDSGARVSLQVAQQVQVQVKRTS